MPKIENRNSKFARAALLAIFAFLISSFVFALPAAAQTPTVVSGTILDPNGIPYSYARVSAQLLPTTATPTILVGGIPVQIGGQQNATTDANGSFSMNLFCNIAGGGCSVISPSGTQWQFTVTTNGIPAPFGTGPQFFSSAIFISNATQSVSATLSAAAPALSRGSGAPTTFSGVPSGSCSSAQTAVDITAGGHFYKCNAGVWQDVGPTAAGAVAWNSLLAPTVNLALNHGAFTTTFTYGAATGAGVNMFNLTDSTNNTGTGYILNVNLAPGSAAKPGFLGINGNGVGVSNAGLLAKAGTGGLDYASLLNFPAACGGIQLATQIAATPGCRVLVGADIPQINLAGTGNGGVGGLLPAANIAPGTLTGPFTFTGSLGAGSYTYNSGNLGSVNPSLAGGGFAYGWNFSNGEGEFDLFTRGGSQGGLRLYNWNGTAATLLMKVDGSGAITIATLPGANITGTVAGANMAQVNLAGSGNGGVGGTLPSANLGATTSNCTGSNFAQGLNAGGTPICGSAVAVAGQVDINPLGSNVGPTTIISPAANGFYRFSCYVVLIRAASTSSTLPSCSVLYTDADTSVAEVFQVTNNSNLNVVGTVGTSFVPAPGFYAKAGAAIQYRTDSYASSGGTFMEYALHVRLEGPF